MKERAEFNSTLRDIQDKENFEKQQKEANKKIAQLELAESYRQQIELKSQQKQQLKDNNDMLAMEHQSILNNQEKKRTQVSCFFLSKIFETIFNNFKNYRFLMKIRLFKICKSVHQTTQQICQ